MATSPAAEFPPSGCARCGLDGRLHFDRWTDAAGWHPFVEPSRELIAGRMRARHAARATALTNDTRS